MVFMPSCTIKFNKWAKQPTDRHSPNLTVDKMFGALSLTMQLILFVICQSWIICLKNATKLTLVCLSL